MAHTPEHIDTSTFTDEQQRLFDEAAALAPEETRLTSTGTITGEILNNNQTPLQTIQAEAPPPTDISGLDVELPELPATPATDVVDDFTTRFSEIQTLLGGEETFRQEQREDVGISALRTTQEDLVSQIQGFQLQAKNLANQFNLAGERIQQESEGRGRTAAGVSPLTASAQRKLALQQAGVASQALTASATLNAVRGQMGTAQRQIDEAVAVQFGALKAEKAAIIENLDFLINSGTLDREERRRATAQKERQETERIRIEKQEDDQKAIGQFAIEAAQRGATGEQLLAIQQSGSPEEALQRASFFLGADFREEIEAKQFQRALQEASFNLSLAKFNEDSRQFNSSQALKLQQFELKQFKELQSKDPVGAAEITSELLQGKIDLINDIIAHPGLAKSVGPSKLSRFTPFRADVLTGEVADFSASVNLLVGRETIDTLINLKARGGTLGALSDQERVLLERSATKIGSWEIKKDGFGTGRYRVSEEDFIIELNRIKGLAQIAKARALGDRVSGPQTPTEEDELRSAGFSPEQIRLIKEAE